MEWVKCSEKMPDVGQRVIGWNGYVIRGCRYRSNSYAKTEKGRQPRFEVTEGIWQGVTHWIPLPEPPAE